MSLTIIQIALRKENFPKESDMSEIKAALVFVALSVAANFCLFSVHTEENWDNRVKTTKKTCETEYKIFV